MIAIEEDENGLHRVLAELRIDLGPLSLEEATTVLGIRPTRTGDAHDAHLQVDGGSERAAGQNVWFLSSEEAVSSRDMAQHIDWLIEALCPVQGALRQLRQAGARATTITCAIWSADGGAFVDLTSQQISKLKALGVGLEFDIICSAPGRDPVMTALAARCWPYQPPAPLPRGADDPRCERADVHLCIYLDAFDPSYATEVLGTVPTSTCQKGRTVTNSLGVVRTNKLNAWFLSSEPVVLSKEFRLHMDWMLDQIHPRQGKIQALRDDGVQDFRLNCYWWPALGYGGPILEPDQISRLADLALDCFFSFSYYALDDD